MQPSVMGCAFLHIICQLPADPAASDETMIQAAACAFSGARKCATLPAAARIAMAL